jgi:hypothetical protein
LCRADLDALAFRTGDDGKILRHYTIPALRTRLPSQLQHPSRLAPRGRKPAATGLAPVEAERSGQIISGRDGLRPVPFFLVSLCYRMAEMINRTARRAVPPVKSLLTEHPDHSQTTSKRGSLGKAQESYLWRSPCGALSKCFFGHTDTGN